jgi:hypothetical protein
VKGGRGEVRRKRDPSNSPLKTEEEGRRAWVMSERKEGRGERRGKGKEEGKRRRDTCS